MMDTPSLSVKIGKLKLKNPVMVASGTFGYAEELERFMDLNKLGALVTKTITLKEKLGNPPPRTVETASGMLNAIGLENPGLEVFLREKLPLFRKTGVPVIVSIAADCDSDLRNLTRSLNRARGVAAIELNLSCPNLGTKTLVAQIDKATYRVVKVVRRVTSLPLIVKLTPNVTDIGLIARAAVSAGADAVSLVNTFLGLAIDVNTRKPKLANITGGLSGPAIKPVALRMVRDVSCAVEVPVVGMGGIMNTTDALEFIIAGSTAIAVGTANFIYPGVSVEIVEGIRRHLRKNRINNINQLIGSLITQR